MHKQFILSALEQAWHGRGSCAPNPSVGAVAVHNNTIIAKAWHRGAGSAHAEQCVLEQLPPNLKGVTLYVTLEPCNHWGKTPPCVSAIIDYGVERVVYGFRDPNPVVVANNTPHILQSKGIEVVHFPLPEIDEFYQSYDYWTHTAKPWISTKLAHSLDGKIAGNKGKRIQLSNEHCKLFTHRQRLYSDVILTTARTVINDDPLLNVRLNEVNSKKPLAILDSQLTLPPDAKIFKTAAHCHIYHDKNKIVTHPQPNCSYYGLPSGDKGRLDLLELFNHLGKLGYHDVWVEAGGVLFSALHDQGLVHTTYLYIVPEILGQEATLAFHGEKLFNRKHSISWQAEDNNVIACLKWQEAECLPD